MTFVSTSRIIALMWMPRNTSDDKITLVQVMSSGNYPLYEPMLNRFMAPCFVTRPPWLNICIYVKQDRLTLRFLPIRIDLSRHSIFIVQPKILCICYFTAVSYFKYIHWQIACLHALTASATAVLFVVAHRSVLLQWSDAVARILANGGTAFWIKGLW